MSSSAVADASAISVSEHRARAGSSGIRPLASVSSIRCATASPRRASHRTAIRRTSRAAASTRPGIAEPRSTPGEVHERLRRASIHGMRIEPPPEFGPRRPERGLLPRLARGPAQHGGTAEPFARTESAVVDHPEDAERAPCALPEEEESRDVVGQRAEPDVHEHAGESGITRCRHRGPSGRSRVEGSAGRDHARMPLPRVTAFGDWP